MRITTVVLAIIMAILSIYLAFYYYQQYDVLKHELNQERYDRYTSEENLETKKLRVKELESKLGRIQKKVDGFEKKYSETKALNSTLKIRLDNAERENKSLKIRAEELESIILNNHQVSQ